MNYEKLTAGTTKTAIDTAKPSEKGEIITYLSRMGDVLHDILDGDKIVHIRCPVNAVHIIVDGDKADVVVGKIVFGVIPHLQIFTPETGHILNDDRADISHFNIIEQLLKARSIEVCAGVAVIHIELGVAHMVFPGVCLEHFLLRQDLSRWFSPIRTEFTEHSLIAIDKMAIHFYNIKYTL